MASLKDYVIGWINKSINEFLSEDDELYHSNSYALITCLDSNPDVSSVFRLFEDKKSLPLLVPNLPVGRGVLVPTRRLIAANQSRRIFFGFDEIWFFPGKKITPKPDDLTITRPGPIDPLEIEHHAAWMNSNGCSLGLGDGEGMNYCLKVQGVARTVVRALNESMTHTSR